MDKKREEYLSALCQFVRRRASSSGEEMNDPCTPTLHQLYEIFEETWHRAALTEEQRRIMKVFRDQVYAGKGERFPRTDRFRNLYNYLRGKTNEIKGWYDRHVLDMMRDYALQASSTFYGGHQTGEIPKKQNPPLEVKMEVKHHFASLSPETKVMLFLMLMLLVSAPVLWIWLNTPRQAKIPSSKPFPAKIPSKTVPDTIEIIRVGTRGGGSAVQRPKDSLKMPPVNIDSALGLVPVSNTPSRPSNKIEKASPKVSPQKNASAGIWSGKTRLVELEKKIKRFYMNRNPSHATSGIRVNGRVQATFTPSSRDSTLTVCHMIVPYRIIVNGKEKQARRLEIHASGFTPQEAWNNALHKCYLILENR